MAIEAKNLSFSYGKNKALENLGFEIEEGEFVAILGPNGAGKTTLLKCILGILKAEGSIKVFGLDPRKDRSILKVSAYVPQRSSLNTLIPLRVEEIVSDADVLKDLELKNYKKKLFGELSGGLQQRVLIARAIAKKPKLVLLDEPFNGVDVPSQKKICEMLENLNATILVVVHNVNPLLHAVDKVMLLNRELIAFGEPKDVFKPENMIKTYGTEIPLVMCEEGYLHPLYVDQHG